MSNKGKVLVTGASGFVALHCIAELLKNEYEVVGTLRSKSREEEVKNGIEKVVSSTNLSFIETHLMTDDGWEQGMTGCKYVMHVAMPFIIAEPKDPDDIRPIGKPSGRPLNALRRFRVRQGIPHISLLYLRFGKEQDSGHPNGP